MEGFQEVDEVMYQKERQVRPRSCGRICILSANSHVPSLPRAKNSGHHLDCTVLLKT